ncbi:c-type cytochrome [Ruixingdingia sedimenti]|uniref:C-type cytochrome n=1 Tax=Ruixingdingia sedimenti TaxID=3073604 RepID=A0ABU1F7N4_9RHOB|nr:c-type cytochrome [Xinfangfangia sp. LG-4]MDR5652891.1 c-type cytochrome [Xinfangfangia sp. LG-4]
MKRIVIGLALLAVAGGALAWVLSAARPLPADAFAGLTGDAARGEHVFTAAGCASCHTAPGASGEARLVLAGGQRFASPFGTFLAPNISSDPTHGIGGWSVADLGNALLRGVSPEGAHYYPAFPYGSYTRMEAQDVADLHAWLATLPADATPSLPHEIGFPFSIRRAVAGWKWLYLDADWVVAGNLTPEETRGRYLAEALGHCGECHTPRNALGGPDTARWLAGAPNPAGEGRIPGITPGQLDWSAEEIASYLETGFTPDYDSVGGHMAAVVENFAKLPPEDRAAVAAYLKRVPPAP